MSEINENLNQEFTMTMESTNVITVPIDNTLTQEGEAADAKAVGDALALKADASSVNTIDVNGEAADNQGHIILTGEHVPMSGDDETTLKSAIETASNRTGADIPLTADSGAATIAAAIAALGTETAQVIPMSDTDSTTVATKINSLETAAAAAVKSVNGGTPDANGDVTINSVPLAANLTSDQSQAVTGSFVIRTTGGSRSVGSGSAQVQEIRGAMVHTGYVEEVLDYDLDETSGITIAIDHDTFVEYVTESGNIAIVYDSAWKIDGTAVDLDDYGITVTGSPNNGDTINITYVVGDRGTITVATPTSFKATGWNLYNPSTGYARVAGYDGKYHVGGTYTSLKYSATLNGEQSAITVTNGSFSVPGDGYVWVTGGNATNTYITTEWTDWTTGPNVDWAAYSETAISISAIMTSYFPYGLMAVGSVYDSINVDTGTAVSRIERIAYDEDDLADIIEEGRSYDADENYIYVVKTTAESHSITLNGAYTASDHGIEEIAGTTVGPVVVILYGQNLKAKLVSDTLTKSQQTLTEVEKKQVQDNIGVTEICDDVKGMLVVESKTLFDNKTLAVSGYDSGSYSVAKTGYTALLAIVTVGNASSSGSGCTNVNVNKVTCGNNNVAVQYKNMGNSSVKIKMTAQVLYRKDL